MDDDIVTRVISCLNTITNTYKKLLSTERFRFYATSYSNEALVHRLPLTIAQQMSVPLQQGLSALTSSHPTPEEPPSCFADVGGSRAGSRSYLVWRSLPFASFNFAI